MATTTQDDWYKGMRIPAGATIIPNHWGMCFRCLLLFLSCTPCSDITRSNSVETYGQKYDPQLFEPRRWIERPGGVGDISEGHAGFGFGRRYLVPTSTYGWQCCLIISFVGLRICPGRHLAAQSLFLVIANLCYSFDIKAKEGKEVDTLAYTTGFNVSASWTDLSRLSVPIPRRIYCLLHLHSTSYTFQYSPVFHFWLLRSNRCILNAASHLVLE